MRQPVRGEDVRMGNMVAKVQTLTRRVTQSQVTRKTQHITCLLIAHNVTEWPNFSSDKTILRRLDEVISLVFENDMFTFTLFSSNHFLFPGNSNRWKMFKDKRNYHLLLNTICTSYLPFLFPSIAFLWDFWGRLNFNSYIENMFELEKRKACM